MADSVEYIGLIRYKGKPLEDGYLDARASARALIGFDGAIRYFNGQQDQELAKSDYPIPVRVRAGSWEALIPHDIASWIQTAAGVAFTAYLAAAATQMAENDFRDMTLDRLFKKSIHAIQWVLKTGKHMGTVSQRTFTDLLFRNNNTEIGIPNNEGKYLYVPKWFLDMFEKMPIHLLRGIASLVSPEIRLEVVVRDGKKDVAESLEVSHKSVFCPDEAEVPFPELVDGMRITLEGLVTRGNGNTNTVGFQYNGHILTCYPKEGDVVRFKPAIFVKSKMTGIVKREGGTVDGKALKPKIVFDQLVPLERESSIRPLPGLFDDADADSR